MTDQNQNNQTPPPQNIAATGPLILRSWPKIILMIPTLIAALICGIIMALASVPEDPNAFGTVHYVGLAFLLVLAINLTMLLYDLTLRGFLIIVLAIVALVLGLTLLDVKGEVGVWKSIASALHMRVMANSAFYFLFALILFFNLVIAWIITRLYYWKVEHNEIIISQGFMHEQERHPTASARFKLVIDDIVEYGLLGCGRLVFYFGDDESQHDLPTVLFVHKKAKRLDELLGRVEVVSHSR